MPNDGPQPIRLIIVTGNPDDADLLSRELSRGGFAPECRVVDREASMREALASGQWDAVISEFSFGSFSASSALAVLRDAKVDLPFIVVSDPVGEEKAIALMRAGAHDFVTRGDLSRLPELVRRELAAAAVRRHHAEDEARIRKEMAAFQSLAENTRDVIARFDRDLRHIYVNRKATDVSGIAVESFIGKTHRDLNMRPALVELLQSTLRKVFTEGVPSNLEFTYDGNGRTTHFKSVFVPEKNAEGVVETVLVYNRDVTEEQNATRGIRQREAALAASQQIAHVGSWELDLGEKDINKNPLRWSDEVFRIFGLEPGSIEVTNDNFFSFVSPEDRVRIEAAVADAIKFRKPYDLEHEVLRRDGSRRWVRERGDVVLDASGAPVRILGTVQDITEHKAAEAELAKETEALARTEQEYRRVLASISDYLWSAQIDEKGVFSYIFYSPVVEKITGYPPEFFMAGPHRWLSTIHEDDRERLRRESGKAMTGAHPRLETEYRIVRPDGEVRWVRDSVSVQKNGNIRLDGVVSDVTERKRAEEQLAKDKMELERTNSILIAREIKMIELKKRLAECAGQPPPKKPDNGGAADLYGSTPPDGENGFAARLDYIA